MASKHTPTPWAVTNNDHDFISSLMDAKIVCRFFDRNERDYPNHIENAQRIVECVNACEGQNLIDVECATAHKQAVLVWETEMMKAIGEDGVGSVSNAIAELKQSLFDTIALLNECRLQVSGDTNLKIHLHLAKLKSNA